VMWRREDVRWGARGEAYEEASEKDDLTGFLHAYCWNYWNLLVFIGTWFGRRVGPGEAWHAQNTSYNGARAIA